MKVLIITNLYPPHYIGGYELICKEITDYLQKDENFEVSVLTSYHGLPAPAREGNIYRLFTDSGHRRNQKIRRRVASVYHFDSTVHRFRSVVNKVQPDLLFLFNLDRLSHHLLADIQRSDIPKLYFISDYWILDMKKRIDQCIKSLSGQSDGLLKRLAKALVSRITVSKITVDWGRLNRERMIFISEDLKRQHQKNGFDPKNCRVIHHSVDLQKYQPVEKISQNGTFNILFVGQVMEHKGVHTIIEAMADIVKKDGLPKAHLSVVGGTVSVEYKERLQKFINDNNLSEIVSMKGAVSRDKVLNEYQRADVLVFPSIWDEPFGITLLEGMACGLPVVGTATGGSKEILQDEINGLVFPPSDSKALSAALEKLMNDTKLQRRLAENARKTMVEKFDKNRKFLEIKIFLNESLAQ